MQNSINSDESRNYNSTISHNDSATGSKTLEKPINKGENNDSDILDSDNNVIKTDLDEFEQVLSSYREEQNYVHEIAKDTNSIDTFFDINIDSDENYIKTENFLDSCEDIDPTHEVKDSCKLSQNIKSEMDVISLSSDDLKICETGIIDLDTISLASSKIFTNFDDINENKSFEINIDINNPIDCPESQSIENIMTDNNLNSIDINLENENSSDCSFHSSDFEFITEEEARNDGLNLKLDNIANENVEMRCLEGNHIIPEGDQFFNLFHGIYSPALIPDLIFLERKSVIPSQCMSVDDEALGFDLRMNRHENAIGEEYQEEAKETAKKILTSYRGYQDNDRRLRRRHI